MSDERKGIAFLNLPTEMICWKCDEVLANPMQLLCGHRICERCLDEVCGSQAEIICKMDKCGEKSRKNEAFRDMCCYRQLQNIKVYCTNRENGCEEVMALKDLKNHTLKNCNFAEKKRTDVDKFSNMQLAANVSEYNANQRGFLEGQLVDACDDGISIRQEYERRKETRKNIHERVEEVKKQNVEVAIHIEDALEVKRKLDSLSVKVNFFETRLDELSQGQPRSADHNGEFIWKVQDYSKKRKQTDYVINSPPFYSGFCGYKMCGRIYLNKDSLGQGTHLSFFFVIMKGEFDALLHWPFQQRVTLMLIDQNKGKENVSKTFIPDSDSSSFTKPQTEMNVASGFPMFVEHSRLETPTYLQDDTIFLKIKVDVIDLLDGASFQGQLNEVEGEEEGQ